jgi:hypothetical protein
MNYHIHTSKFHPSSEACQQLGCVFLCGIRALNALESNRALQMKRALMMGHIHTSKFHPSSEACQQLGCVFLCGIRARNDLESNRA